MEGQAASDEEEEAEEKWQQEQRSLAEVKMLLACLSGCGSGYVGRGGGASRIGAGGPGPFTELDLGDLIQVQAGSPQLP